MIINHRLKFVYLLMPRTASRSIRMALMYLKQSELEKIAVRHYYIVPPSAKGYYFFCAVRNPYDRILSLYLHRVRRKEIDFSFERYINQIDLRRDVPEQPITQILERYKIKLNHYIRFEDLPWSLEEVPILKGEEIKRFIIGQSPTYEIDNYYTPESIEKVKDLYSEDFETFKYDTEYEG